MGLVGKDIDSLLETHERFSLRTCLHIGVESSLGIEELNDLGFLHRDVKPANMAIGRAPNLRRIYILDGGMCRKYVDDKGAVHQPRIRASFCGTPRYASANALENVDQGRVDDMWSWILTLVELMVGKLPWDGKEGPEEKEEWLAWLTKKKRNCMNDPNIMLRGCPREYRKIYDSLTVCKYAQKPDYSGFRTMLNASMARKGYKEATPLDWESEEQNVANDQNSGSKEGTP